MSRNETPPSDARPDPAQPEAASPPRKKRGPIRKFLRLIAFLVLLVLVVAGTAPLWLSTTPGTNLLAAVASRFSGEKITIEDLDLGYSGDLALAGLVFGELLELDAAELSVTLASLTGGRPEISGKVSGVTLRSVKRTGDSPGQGGRGGGIPFPPASIDLEIAGADVILRDETITPATEDRLEGLSGRLRYSSSGGFDGTSVELAMAWQRIAIAGIEVEANAIDLRLEEQRLELAPVTARVSGGDVTAGLKLDLSSGQEKLVFSLTAEGVRPTDDLPPTRGVAINGDLSGVSFLRGFIDRGQPFPPAETILAGLEGAADLRVGELAYRPTSPLPVLGELITIRNLDGQLTFSGGVAAGENLVFELQDGDVSADVQTAQDGVVSITLQAAAPGKRSGRLPVKNLSMVCTVSGDLSHIDLQATCDQLVVQEGDMTSPVEITSLEVVTTYDRKGEGPSTTHAFEFSKLDCVVDGGTVSVAGAGQVAGETANFKGKVRVDGYELFAGAGAMKNVTLDADLTGIPIKDAKERLDQLRGSVVAGFGALPTDFGKLTSGTASCKFEDGRAELERLHASMKGGKIDAVARFFLGKLPADVSFEISADGVSLEDAEGPVRNVVLRGDFEKFALLDGFAQPGLTGKLSGSFDALPLPAVTLGLGTITGVAKNGRLDVTTMDFDAAPGKVTGSGWIDLAQDPPAWELDVDNDRVTIRRGFGNVLGYIVPVLSAPSGNLGGQLASDLHLTGRGFTGDQIRSDLAGSGNLSLVDGQVSGSPVLRSLVPVVGALDMVGIESIECKFDIGQGQVRSDDLDMNLFYRDKPIFLGFKGWCDFDTNIDYGIKLRAISGFLPEQARAITEMLGSDITFPLHLMGKLSSPSVGVPPLEEVIKEVGAGLKGSGVIEELKRDPSKLLDLFGGSEEPAEEGGGEKPDDGVETTPPK